MKVATSDLVAEALAEQRREDILASCSQTILIARVDALEELSEETAYHLLLFWLYLTALDFLHGNLSLFDMSTVGMCIQVCLISIHRVVSLG